MQLQSRPAGRSVPFNRTTSDVSEISISSSLPHPNNPELWEGLSIEQSRKSQSLVRWLMRHQGENITSCLIPGLLFPVIALAFAQQRLTRCSSCKRASIFHIIVFSVLEGKGELHGPAVLQRGQVPSASCTQPTFSPIIIAQLPQSSQQYQVSGAGGSVSLHVLGVCGLLLRGSQKMINKPSSPVSQFKFDLHPPWKYWEVHRLRELKTWDGTWGDFPPCYQFPY